jgi:hypothetical protein
MPLNTRATRFARSRSQTPPEPAGWNVQVLGTCQVGQPGVHLQRRGTRHGGPSACNKASHNSKKHEGGGKLPGQAMLATSSSVNQIGDKVLLHVVDCNGA